MCVRDQDLVDSMDDAGGQRCKVGFVDLCVIDEKAAASCLKLPPVIYHGARKCFRRLAQSSLTIAALPFALLLALDFTHVLTVRVNIVTQLAK